MRKLNKFLKFNFSFLLVLSLVLPFFVSKSVFADEKIKDVETLISQNKDEYDILIKFKNIESSIEDKKELTRASQKEALDILYKAKSENKVEKIESFYIVNAIHAVVKDKNIIRKIINLENVEKITENYRIKKIEPVKKKRKSRSTIFVPDEKNIEWGVSNIGADKVWRDFNITGKGVTVGIIDTGVNYNLLALRKNFKGYDEKTDSITNKQYYKDFIDGLEIPEKKHVNDHGTHVMGSILGKEKENVNQIGVAPGAKFISARALDDNGGDTSNLLAAAQWLLEQKVDVINNSWGGTNDDNTWFKEIAKSWRKAGIVSVFASGNKISSSDSAGFGSIANPGNLMEVFAVGAVDINKNIASFSKKGPSIFDKTKKVIKPDVVAPGVQVRSVDATGTYVSWNGTSMATPHVTGVVALLKEANKNLSVDEIENIIKETAEPLKDTEFDKSPNMAYGYGMVNAYDAVSKALGKKIGSICGKVYKDGEDKEKAKAQFLNLKDLYVGRDANISLKISDDVSIKSAKLFYKFENDIDFKQKDLKLTVDKQNDGIYQTKIDSNELKEGKLILKAEIVDFGENVTEVQKELNILSGIKLPWKEDFESTLNGFEIEGNFKVSTKISKNEPELLNGSKKYIGVDAGSSDFKKRVDNYLYLPPIDLSSFKKDTDVFFSMNEYKGFTGISIAKIQYSLDGKEFKDLHNVILRPDITQRNWEYNTYSLKQFSGEKRPLLLRLYFRGHDSDSGCGWYIDNMSIDTKDIIKPTKVTKLWGLTTSKGLKLSFKKNEDTDFFKYIVQRKEEGKDFEEIKDFNEKCIEEFVDNGKEKTHYTINYFDDSLDKNKKYSYRVKVLDLAKNESEYSEILDVDYSKFEPIISYDFEENDGGFKADIENSDWEYGKPQRPEGDLTLLPRNAWDGLNPITKLWATKLNSQYSQNMSTSLYMPEFKVPDSECFFYMDSFSTANTTNGVTFIVEIKEKEKESWNTLFSENEIKNPKTKDQWIHLSKSLEEYKSKGVQVRFRMESSSGVIFDYELGWYIDNISVGSKQIKFESKENVKDKNENKINEQTTSEESFKGIPLGAKITILETGKFTFASEIDGSFNIKTAVNEKNKPYTLKVTAYGYETLEKKVDLSEKINVTEDFLMKKASTSSVMGKILDENKKPLKDVTVTVVDDDSIETTTDDKGEFKLSDIFTGKYKIRIFKDGFVPKVVDIDLQKDNLVLKDITITKRESLKEKILDYGFNVKKEDGIYQTIHFEGSLKGTAVKFQSPYKGAILKDADIFLVNNKYYAGNHIKVGVLSYDEYGRLREIVPFKEVKDVKINSWNKIDFTKYNIKTDKPIYIATRYEKEISQSAGVFYDVNASDDAKKHSFIYDGAFIKTSILPAVGGYAVKTTFLYNKDAKENEEEKIDEGSEDNFDGSLIRPKMKTEFIFDKETKTITGYKGNEINLTVPSKIDGIEVKKIAKGAFDKTNKSLEKIRKLTISEGIEEIGENAFKNNDITEVVLPKTLKKIEKGAFYGQWKSSLEDKSFKINIPDEIHVIEESVFESSGSPLVVNGAKNLKEIKDRAFASNKDVEINAPNLEKISDKAFSGTDSFNYAKIFTDNKTLRSKQGQYLINPALVTINMIDAKDLEKVYKIGLKYGEKNPKSIKRTENCDEFYKIKDTVTIKAPSFKDDKTNKIYVSNDKEITLTLEKENTLSFKYYPLEPEIRLPILDTDKDIVGFSLPNAKISIYIENVLKTVTANEDGFFSFKDLSLKENEKIKFLVNDKDALSLNVTKLKTSGDYIEQDNKILRYVGENKDEIKIPNSIGNSTNIKEISDFAFYGKNIKTVVLTRHIETIGNGAFLNVGLKNLKFDVSNLNEAKLRLIKDYAFKDNELKDVQFPEITHVIRLKAFENNKIENLSLGKYTGHIGKCAFKNNKIKNLTITSSIEEIGKEAFMNNEIETLLFNEPIKKDSDDGLKEITNRVFKNNKIKEVKLIDSIVKIEKDAFDENPNKVKVISDNEKLNENGNNFIIVRTSGKAIENPENPENPEVPEHHESNPSTPSGSGSSSGSDQSNPSTPSGSGSSSDEGNQDREKIIEFIKGENQTFIKEEDKKLIFELNDDVKNFKDVYVDNKIVDKSMYKVTSGSTIIEFTKEFTDSLEEGKHEFKFNFKNGTSKTKVLVLNKNKGEKTKEEIKNSVVYSNSRALAKTSINSNIYIYILLSLISLSLTIILKRKKL